MNRNNNNKNIIIILLIIIIAILATLVVLFATNTITLNSNATKDVKETETKTTEDKINELEEIAGNYNFSEFAEPNQNRDYEVKVYKENDEYFAILSIDGFQTIKRIETKVTYTNGEYSFIFNQYLEDNIGEIYNTGDVLFKLYKKDNTIYTSWIKLQPMLETNTPDGIYFK